MDMIKKKEIITGYENMKIGSYNGPPYSYSVRVNGKLRTMIGFDEEHIRNQLWPKRAKTIRKIKDR